MIEQQRVEELRRRFNASMRTSGRRCVYTQTSDKDSLGRCSFTLQWVGTDAVRLGKVRGQCFFARPEGHVEFDAGLSC